MAVAGGQLAKKLGIALLGDLIFWLGCKAVKNKLEGKTIFGKKVESKKPETYVDWRGRIVLGTNDFEVV